MESLTLTLSTHSYYLHSGSDSSGRKKVWIGWASSSESGRHRDSLSLKSPSRDFQSFLPWFGTRASVKRCLCPNWSLWASLSQSRHRTVEEIKRRLVFGIRIYRLSPSLSATLPSDRREEIEQNSPSTCEHSFLYFILWKRHDLNTASLKRKSGVNHNSCLLSNTFCFENCYRLFVFRKGRTSVPKELCMES